MKKAIIYLMLVLGVIGLVGCGKGKGETSSNDVIVATNVVKGNTYDEKVMELLTNEKYQNPIKGDRVTYYKPEYKELVFETYANRETPKNQMINFHYETEKELNELIEYAKEFNKTHERMKLSEEPHIVPQFKTIGFVNTFPELDKK
jgi:lipoprotein